MQIIISNTILIILGIALVLSAIVFLVFYLLKAQKQAKLQEEKYKELELKMQSMEVENFKHKLNPHLFKNTLNSIQSHAYQTYYALDKLSNVLDFILYESDSKYVSIKEEVDFALSLIEINRLKVSPLFDLRVKNKINLNHPLYNERLMAPLITIDMIENAFKHADLQSPDAFISIIFELDSDDFKLTVSNKISTKTPIKKDKSGFGKESFKKRLLATYRENYKFDQFIEEDVYITHLKIKILEHKTQMFTA
ncbi:MAG: histidine kinase [Bacteroidota bacterium]